jgi:GSH-dependent disulfide-bond oxidoreductase
MIELYYQPSPNTWKVSIMLEECGLPYVVKPINISNGDQRTPEFLAINPNGRIPAIVDTEGPSGDIAIFESGAILVYLAEKAGRLLPASGVERYDALQWLFWQMGGLGPMLGQAHVFRNAADRIPFAIDRYTNEATRLYGVMDRRLGDRAYLAGAYGVADIACFGWVWFHNMHGQDLAHFPNVAAWFERVGARDAVKRGRLLGLDMVSEQQAARLGGKEWPAA